ncbi:hypothetical protein EsVE80_16680 [Enterococcus saigonensis]|uniref:Uncharacterized protein n=1 Tax=Enterococcus saigonensis TaxID=1805431 RepID=A0A679IKR3_9ENTE|nr:hypothetical protein [Enterococcus saigonensis]BCA86145.1 hypothetical protein EsVE80_16680 [Enterococcus saigonensis]
MKYAITEFFRHYRQGIIFFEQLLFIPTMVMMLATGMQHFVRFFLLFLAGGIIYTLVHFLLYKNQSRTERLYALIHPKHDRRENILVILLTLFLLYAFIVFNF